MGCDIHAYVEYIYDGDTYTNVFCYGEINFGRDYELFSLIAGVRGISTPIVSPRGFPNDCIKNGDTSIFESNFLVAEEYRKYGSGAHTPTWLTLDELKKIRVEYIKEKSECGSVIDKLTMALLNNQTAMDSVFTYTFGDNENSGLYLSIVIMESLLKLHPDIRVRFVCWFDS